MNWNAPRASATVSRLPPMLPRGLERVTVAPGRTAPEASVTVPAIAPTPCAAAGRGRHITHADTTTMLTMRDPVIVLILLPCCGGCGGAVRSSERIHRACRLARFFQHRQTF